MSLTLDMKLRRGALDLAIELEVAPGETLAVVGPNGAGKTSLLQVVAGLLRIDQGRVTLDGRLLDGGAAGTFVEPADRELGYLFQDHRLFPQMSVLDNVAFGPRVRGRSRREARERAMAWLGSLGLEACRDLRPAALSGGQAQKVALARALAGEPRLLLLDEPLSAVDASARLELRRGLREHLAAFAGIRLLVAHDIEDAVALADRIAVLEGGRVVQVGRVDEVLARPASLYASDLVGLNFYVGRCAGAVARVGDLDLVTVSDLTGDVAVTIHPRTISLFLERPQGSPRNCWRAPVIGLDASLGRMRVRFGGVLPIVAEVTPAAVRELGLAVGRELWLTIKATEIGVAAR
ncbi:MAG: ABC transporter ATP-binding protein [Planctomycetes bacterium]|nr:ABC transporter ATP-binding protein [Planctomycetota bacterium]